MTHPFVKAYVSVCKELLLPLGFKCKGRYFYRIVNDVYQDLALKLYRDGKTYSVFFGFLPFCCGLEAEAIYTDSGSSFYLENAALILYRGDTESECLKNAEQLGKVISEHTIPLYERVTNTASAFAEWHRIELERQSKSNLSYPLYLFSEFPDYIIVEPQIWMAITLGEYDYAVKGLRQRIEIDKWGCNQENGDWFRNQIKQYEEMIERIQARDMDWINGFIAANERKSRIELELEKE